MAAQAARLLRQSEGRQDEHVTLLTSAEPQKLDAQKWLELNRLGFGGIENGLHQRLDISHNDDRCRIRFAKCGWEADSAFPFCASRPMRPNGS